MATTNEIKRESGEIEKEMNALQNAIDDNIVETDNAEETLEAIDIIHIDEPVDAESVREESDDGSDIDAVCEMLNDAKRERNDQIVQQQRNEEMQRKIREAEKRAESERELLEEETRRIRENRSIRKKMKRRATMMLFCLCIMSAVFGYVVAGILIHILFNPEVWIFVGVMGIFGMVNTLVHTYLYRFIREEIYRK
jgi:hypothetical protein